MSPEARDQFQFSQQATSLQSTSIKEHYTPKIPSSNDLQPTTGSPSDIVSPNNDSESLTSSSTVSTLRSWLCRRGPDCSKTVSIDITSTPGEVSLSDNSSQPTTTPLITIIASILQLRGFLSLPTTQPVCCDLLAPPTPDHLEISPSLTAQLSLPTKYSVANDTTWQDRFPTLACAQEQHISLNSAPHNQTNPEAAGHNSLCPIPAFSFCWNGEVFASQLDGFDDAQVSPQNLSGQHHLWESIEQRSDTATITSLLQAAIRKTPLETTAGMIDDTTIREYSHTIATITHDILNQIQGPFAMSLSHISEPVQIASHERVGRIITTVFGRDKLGRRSLLFRPIHDVNHSPESKSNEDCASFSGFILASQALNLSPCDDASCPSHPDFTLHNSAWHEIPCNGLFYSSTVVFIDSKSDTTTTAPPSPRSSLHFLPWNFSIISQFLHPSSSSSHVKIPSSFLFPAFSPAAIPWPSPLSILPQILFPAFISLGSTISSSFSPVSSSSPSPSGSLPAQIFLLLLAQAVARHVHAMPHSSDGSLALPSPSTTESKPSAPIAVLFSGGIDCTMLAALLHCYLPANHPIDLITTAYLGDVPDPFDHYAIERDIPDRVAGIAAFEELSRIFPSRQWRLIKVNITPALLKQHATVISSLIAPQCTAMDFNIGSILYFSARGQGILHPLGFTLPYPSKQSSSEQQLSLPTPEQSDNAILTTKQRLKQQQKLEQKVQNRTTVRYAGGNADSTSGTVDNLQFDDDVIVCTTPTPIQGDLQGKLSQQQRQMLAKQQADAYQNMILNESVLSFVEFAFSNKILASLHELQLVVKQYCHIQPNGILEFDHNAIQAYISEHSEIVTILADFVIKTKPNKTIPKPIWQRLSKIAGLLQAHRKNVQLAKNAVESFLMPYCSSEQIDTILQRIPTQCDNVSLDTQTLLSSLRSNILAISSSIDTVQFDTLILAYISSCHDISAFTQQHEIELHLVDVILNQLPVLRAEDCYALQLPPLPTLPNTVSLLESSQTHINEIYTSVSRVLLLGSGADEQLAGYGRHRTAFKHAMRHVDTTQDRSNNSSLTTTITTPAIDSEEPTIADQWLGQVFIEDGNVQDVYNAMVAHGEPLTPCDIWTIQQVTLYRAIRQDTLRLWLRNLGRDDRVLSFWGREARLPFLDEDLTSFISLFRVASLPTEASYMTTYDALSAQIQNISQSDQQQYFQNWTEIMQPFFASNVVSVTTEPCSPKLHFPLHSLCDLRYNFGIGEKMILRQCAHAMGIQQAATLHKRAMQFGTKIANRTVVGTTKLHDINSLDDILNPYLC